MDFFEKQPVSLHLSGMELIDEDRSVNYEKIQLFLHRDLGKILVLDDEIQHIENWSPFYHETIVHLPTAFIDEVETVLILGGGCFFTAKEVLKYETVKKVVMIDYDSSVIRMMEKHYPHAAEIIQDPRFHLIINDAFDEIKKITARFDLVINDSIDLLSANKQKHTGIFLELARLTTAKGVCVDMIYRHIFEKESTKNTFGAFAQQKMNAAFSLITVPEYPGVLHLVSIWTQNKNVYQTASSSKNKIQLGWLKNPSSNPCELFDPRFLSYYLYLPPYLKRIKE